MKAVRATVAACLLACTGCALPGYESPGFRGQIQSEIDRLHITGRVALLGPVAPERRWAAFDGADLFILPTLADSWGLVVNEAMMAGVPVLGSDRSQAVEQTVVDGQNGWIFSPESPTHVRAALDRALRAPPNLLAMMKANARETALRFSPEHVADCMEAAIQRCFA